MAFSFQSGSSRAKDRIRKGLINLIAALWLGGCGPDGSSAKPAPMDLPPSGDPQESAFDERARAAVRGVVPPGVAGLDDIANACSSIRGGVFDGFRVRCRCAQPGQAFVFSTSAPVCVAPLSIEPLGPSKAPTPVTSSPETNADLELALSSVRLPGGTATLEIAGSRGSSVSQPSIVDLRPHVWAGSTSSFTVSIRYRAGAFEADTAFIASLLDPPAPGVSQGRAAAELRETLYEPDAGSIGDAFSAENLRAPKLESPPSTFGSNDATLARLVYKLALFVAPGATETPWHALEGDCRHVCRLSSAFPSRAASAGELIGEALRVELARLGLIAERRVLAVHGSAAWDRIFVRNESSADIVAVVQLTPKGGVSSIAFFDSRSESGRVLARARVFDRRWRLIGDVDLGGFDASQEIRAVSRAPRATGETVVLCEPSVLSSTLAAQGVLPMLTRGPHASDDPRAGALHGWLANPRGRSGDYWDGVARVNGIISHSPHAALVARTFIEASGDSPGRFALATPRTCLAHFDETSESFRRAGVKILNFSGGESESRAACAASPFARPFRNASSGFLWILASGNNREENPDFRCPQTLGPRADLLVVAGLPIGSTDYGRRYADLAAEQTGPDRRLGSSFAAPRVSAAAQAVARREPSLTPEDIRIVILASVRIPRGPSGALAPLAVRSGGALDPEAALRAAAQATQIKRGSQTIALDDLFRRLYDPLEASARVRWARDSGLLEPRAR